MAYASLASLVGEFYLWYWLTRGDGFDVTKWIISDFLVSMNAISDDHFRLLVQLGGILHAQRYDALVFKKNAGKYVGNYNFGDLREITRRADLVLMNGVGVNPNTATSILDYVQRVLSINVMAGEKSIPQAVKRFYVTKKTCNMRDERIRSECDAFLAEHYSFSNEELDFIINYDIKYRMGAEASK